MRRLLAPPRALAPPSPCCLFPHHPCSLFPHHPSPIRKAVPVPGTACLASHRPHKNLCPRAGGKKRQRQVIRLAVEIPPSLSSFSPRITTPSTPSTLSQHSHRSQLSPCDTAHEQARGCAERSLLARPYQRYHATRLRISTVGHALPSVADLRIPFLLLRARVLPPQA